MSHTQTGVAAESLSPSNRFGRTVSAARLCNWTRLAVARRVVINYLAPIGYEDEIGFQFGEARVSNNSADLRADVAQDW
jgi:hypothetical protein